MPRAFSQIAYTPSVRAAQSRYGSRAANAGFDLDPNTRNVVTEREIEFIPSIDTFFISSVGENGWPYVQHRGGPKGFLKILDERTLGFADFSGNRQYITSGNVMHDDRVMLILIDYATRRRLKIWGRARILHEDEDPELIARLEVPSYRARIERAFVITVEAFDFNCPQHITPRFTEQEIAQHAATLFPQKTVQAPVALGSGELELVISGMRQLTPRIRAYELRHPDGSALPAVTAGAHLSVPVRLQDGSEQIRSYSIASDPTQHAVYEIAVLRDDSGRGGSLSVHHDYALGTVLRCGLPANHFQLHEDARPAVLIAGGIGITPVKAMAHALLARTSEFQLHYAARSPAEMAYRSEITGALQERAHFYFSDAEANARLNVQRLVADAPDEAVFYVCGPARLIDEVRTAGEAYGIDSSCIRYERFVAPVSSAADKPVEVKLHRSGRSVQVAADQTILDAVLDAGVSAPFECRTGTCGTCATKVIDGTPDHRDSALTQMERDGAALMCICVSRAAGDRLVLDL